MTSKYDPAGAHVVQAALLNTTSRADLVEKLLKIEARIKQYDFNSSAYPLAEDILHIIKGRS